MKSKIYQKIKEKIVLLDYKPGETLVLKNLAQQFGTSVTPVRETLIRLESENLVICVPNNSIRVTEISFQDLKNVFEVRLFLAGKVGRLAAQRISGAELSRIRKLINRMKQEKDRRVLIKLDLELHDLINLATKNEALVRVLEMLRNQVARLWFFMGDQDAYSKGMARDFEKLLKSLEAKDSVSSEQILQHHIIQFVEEVKESISECISISNYNTKVTALVI